MMDSQSSSRGEHYNLRWNNYTNNLIQVFSEHQHHETLVDVTLTCEGQFIKAHKLILSACSGFFEDMFKIHGAVQHPFIVLNGIKFNHLKHILEFIYHGEVKILDEDLEGVLALGENFQIKGLSSVKIKHQMSATDRPPLIQSSPDPTISAQSSTASTPNLSMNQQKENRNFTSTTGNNNQDKSKESRGFKRVQVISSGRTEQDVGKHVQSRVGMQNGKETVGPASKRTKTPEISTVTSSSPEIRLQSTSKENIQDSDKIPRPTNPFMIFANEWRKKLAVEHPDENNKSISVMLGNMWKTLTAETKESYYLAARKAQKEYELKNPSYKLQEKRKKKAVRRKTIDSVSQLAFVDMQECDGDDDDLQIIEINEDPIDITGSNKSNNPAL